MSELNGRPRKEIDWDQLDSIASRDGSLDYCAERQCVRWGEEVSKKTIKACREILERRVQERYECTFTEYKHKKMEGVRIGLRGKQIELALKGNVVLLIWLGKVMLGQRDPASDIKFFADEIRELPQAELIALAKKKIAESDEKIGTA